MSRFSVSVERLALAGLLSFACSLGPAAFAAATGNDEPSETEGGPRATHGTGQSSFDQSNLGQRAPATMPSGSTPIAPSGYVGPDGLLPNGLLPNPPTYG